ncbi:transglycosylase family protein [Arthrobacter sp. TMT4-20]
MASRNRWIKTAGQGIVMMCLVLGLVAFVGNNKSIVLNIDGQASTVQTFGGTVGEVLANSNVVVTENDQVTPSLAAAVEDGSAIQITRATAIDVVLNGADTVVHTTGSTVGDVVNELGVADSSAISADLETRLTTLSSELEISTPKSVTVTVDGSTATHTSTVKSVQDLFDEAEIVLGDEDRVSVPVTSSLVDGLGLKITRVDSDHRETVTESISFTTDEVHDDTLDVGEQRVTRAGVDGERTKIFTAVVIDGREENRELLSDKVTLEPVTELLAIGTREPKPEPKPEPETKPEPEPERVEVSAPVDEPEPAGSSGPAPAGGDWQALAQCESGGNWSINTGNGYYGGLQFSAPSWLGAGGGKYAPLPHLASPAEQIATAEVLKQNGGWGHWPSCSAKLGLG